MAPPSSFFPPLLLLLSISASLVSAAPESALVASLPGFDGAFPSKHYSGYVTVDENHEKNLFYYFVVSEGDPSKDPVVLWLNGGPGYSSFDGFIYEHGPFNFEAGEAPASSMPKLHLNPYSWSKVSSIIYLDSPAGVGFSYSRDETDYTTGDLKTAKDTHTFLLKWFELYPEFLENPFYISGESYAGIYIPTLAAEVANGIIASVKPALNFKGYMIGNGCTDEQFDGDALVPFAHGMCLISNDLFQEVNSACQGSYWNPVNETCEEKLNKVDQELKDLNIYDVLEPCYHHPEIRYPSADDIRLPSSFRRLGVTDRPLHVRRRMFGRSWPFRATVRAGRVPTWTELGRRKPLCTDDRVATVWLNNEAVRTAIHAQPASAIGEWVLDTDILNFTHDAGSMIKYHKYLISLGYRALIFSGDHDMCVPFTGSEAWTRSMGYKIVDLWRPWYFNDQVAGYTQSYEHDFRFLTIKGAGHTVPEYKPKEALYFYSHWLQGKSI